MNVAYSIYMKIYASAMRAAPPAAFKRLFSLCAYEVTNYEEEIL